MKTTKKLLAMALAAAMVVTAFAGCSGNNDTSSADSTSSASSEASTSSDASTSDESSATEDGRHHSPDAYCTAGHTLPGL